MDFMFIVGENDEFSSDKRDNPNDEDDICMKMQSKIQNGCCRKDVVNGKYGYCEMENLKVRLLVVIANVRMERKRKKGGKIFSINRLKTEELRREKTERLPRQR